MKPKLTPWYRSHSRPARVGAYQTSYVVAGSLRIWYSWWDGVAWGLSEKTIARAAASRQHHSYEQGKIWRGLAAQGAQP